MEGWEPWETWDKSDLEDVVNGGLVLRYVGLVDLFYTSVGEDENGRRIGKQLGFKFGDLMG